MNIVDNEIFKIYAALLVVRVKKSEDPFKFIIVCGKDPICCKSLNDINLYNVFPFEVNTPSLKIETDRKSPSNSP